jgi:hypothetical protein
MRKNKVLDKETQFQQIIDNAYSSLFRPKKDNWETELEKVNLLIKTTRKKCNKVRDLRIKEGINELLNLE